MKTVGFILIGLFAVCASTPSQAAENKYSGRADVDGLGIIAFPAGEWLMEFQRVRVPTNSDLPDYFVFKRTGDRLERLTFLRYPSTTRPRPLAHMLDTVGETMGDGVPLEEKKEGLNGGEIHTMRLDPQSPSLTERTIRFSFIHVRPDPETSWLCHSYLFSHMDCAFVIAHASPSVLSPEVVADVQFRSRFSPGTRLVQNGAADPTNALPVLVIRQAPDYPAAGRGSRFPGGLIAAVWSDGRVIRPAGTNTVGKSYVEGVLSANERDKFFAFLTTSSAFRNQTMEGEGIPLHEAYQLVTLHKDGKKSRWRRPLPDRKAGFYELEEQVWSLPLEAPRPVDWKVIRRASWYE